MAQINRDEILKQAKSIMDRFHSALAGVERIEEARVERDECEREEKEAMKPDSEFREIMFQNAPERDGECIKAEKGAWTGK